MTWRSPVSKGEFPFSERVPSLVPNALTQRLHARRAAGLPLVDLTRSNPTTCEIFGPEDAEALQRALAVPGVETYGPNPRGAPKARELIGARLPRQLPAEQVVLTASTSEAYSLLFKLLCDPGDAVLIPRPSYPLFEHLCRLDGIVAEPYALDYAGAWQLDLEQLASAYELARAASHAPRALLVVNPNNPTGHAVDGDELAALEAFCAERGMALIGDEVFFAYLPMGTGASRRYASVSQVTGCLSFCLGGLSKLGGLPQLKLGWIGCGGPENLVVAALERLDLIADAYLSVGSPVQLAAEALLTLADHRRRRIAARLAASRLVVDELCAAYPAATPLVSDGGWTAVLRLPSGEGEEVLVTSLLDDEGVLVHPGYFFDFTRGAHLVLSLLTPPEVLEQGLMAALARACR